jgi:hypothetical protein
MTQPQALERELLADLDGLGDRLADERFCADLYRALTRTTWSKRDVLDDHVALSFARAEEIVNELHARHSRPQMELSQTGGEGEVAASVAAELERRGWHAAPMDTGSHDEGHLARPRQPPPPDQGEAQSPTDHSRAWEREAREEAHRGAVGDGRTA